MENEAADLRQRLPATFSSEFLQISLSVRLLSSGIFQSARQKGEQEEGEERRPTSAQEKLSYST